MTEMQSTTAPRRRLHPLVKLLIFGLLLVLVPVALLYLQQHSMIYYARPYPPGFERLLPPNALQLEYSIQSGRKQAKQLAFYIAPRSGAAMPDRIWVAFSGNASLALDWLYVGERNPNQNDAFLLVDYPGYGRSEGHASIARTRASADAALATLATRLNVAQQDLEPRLCALGLSLGAAAALEFAAGHPVQRVVLVAPFTTLREVAAALFSRPISWLLTESYDNRSRVAELAKRTPPPRVAIFHGTADTLIPVAMGRELAESAPGVVEFFPIENANHDTIAGEAMDAMIAWMNR